MEEAKDLMYFLLPFGNDNDKAKGWGPGPPPTLFPESG